ncbi:hypothetical protein [uncultured Propionibacterium sp.]|uniref:hypothetical protein n=1 Tax=uncultured Propionibacterium sp. TaxID=218066 RepID=UPI00292FAC19|nr:hypothetical protein [uncultured Propionibacterium sp.]
MGEFERPVVGPDFRPGDEGPARPQALHHKPASPAPAGALTWFLGMIAFIGLPFVNLIITGVVMIAVGVGQRRMGGPAGRSAAGAMRWGIGVATTSAALLVGFFGVLSAASSAPGLLKGFFPLGSFLVAWVLLTLVHLIVCIVQGVRASGSGAVAGAGPGPGGF